MIRLLNYVSLALIETDFPPTLLLNMCDGSAPLVVESCVAYKDSEPSKSVFSKQTQNAYMCHTQSLVMIRQTGSKIELIKFIQVNRCSLNQLARSPELLLCRFLLGLDCVLYNMIGCQQCSPHRVVMNLHSVLHNIKTVTVL